MAQQHRTDWRMPSLRTGATADRQKLFTCESLDRHARSVQAAAGQAGGPLEAIAADVPRHELQVQLHSCLHGSLVILHLQAHTGPAPIHVVTVQTSGSTSSWLSARRHLAPSQHNLLI